MPKLLLISIKSESPGVGLGFYYVFKAPEVIRMYCQIVRPLIRALNFRGTGHKLRSLVDGLTWYLLCTPALVVKGRNSPLGAHIPQGFVFCCCLGGGIFPPLYTVDFYCCCFSAFECRSPIDIGGGAAPGPSLECTIENSLVLLEREFCPELFTRARV